MATNEPAENSALTAELQRLAKMHRLNGKRIYGMDFDYSEESLKRIDEAITKFHPEGASMETTIVVYGAYIGETMRRTLGGVWAQDGEGNTYLGNVGAAGIQAFPLSWAQKRFANGIEDSIAYKYSYVKSEVMKANGGVLPTPAAIAEPPDEPVGPVTEEDYQKLARAPLLVFAMVAAADGKVGKKELQAFEDALNELSEHPCELMRQAMERVGEDLDAYISSLEQEKEDSVILTKQIGELLDAKFQEQAQEFKKALVHTATKIAAASGGFLGLGSKISKNEAATILIIAGMLGLDLSEEELT
jgi:tellurite resistance protein